MQRILSASQLSRFYKDAFAEDQVDDFVSLVPEDLIERHKVILDVGGGIGIFARLLQDRTRHKIRVMDTDRESVDRCRKLDIDAVLADATSPPRVGDEGGVCFNLILHHLVGDSESSTRAMQMKALRAWRDHADYVFVNEYVFDSRVGYASGRLIYEITRNRLLSAAGRSVSRFVPSLRANTFGVGVRFRAHDEWADLFRDCGYRVAARHRGKEESVSLPRQALLIKSRRRDSFLLVNSERVNPEPVRSEASASLI